MTRLIVIGAMFIGFMYWMSGCGGYLGERSEDAHDWTVQTKNALYSDLDERWSTLSNYADPRWTTLSDYVHTRTPGRPAPRGKPGDDGTSCKVEELVGGDALIICEDGTMARIEDGERGHAGRDGKDGESIVGPAGADGKDGESIVGPQGEVGPAGPRGETGPQGDRGPKGDKGNPGKDGKDKTKGPKK